MAQFFRGTLAGLMMRSGKLENKKVIDCLYTCKEGLDLQTADGVGKGLKVTGQCRGGTWNWIRRERGFGRVLGSRIDRNKTGRGCGNGPWQHFQLEEIPWLTSTVGLSVNLPYVLELKSLSPELHQERSF